MKLFKGSPLSFLLPFVLFSSSLTALCAIPTEHAARNMEINAICKDSIYVYLDQDGLVSIDPSAIDDGSFNAVNPAEPLSLFLSQDLFNCQDMGANTVELAVVGSTGQSTCFSQVVVFDLTGPSVTCSDMTFSLPSNGNLNLSIADFLMSAEDNCSIDSYLINQSDYNCSDLGENTVIISLTDGQGNESSCTSILTIIDDSTPIPQCQDILVELDTMGVLTLTESMISNGVTDNCFVTDVSFSPSQLDCSHVGTVPVELVAMDNAGNIGICYAFVEVIDDVAPEVLCQDIEVNLEEDLVSIVLDDVYISSFDACGIYSLTISEERFSCSEVGENTVTVLAYDNNGNAEACSATVSVFDVAPPVAACKDTLIELQIGQQIQINPLWIDAGSVDNCMIDSMLIDKSDFSCFDIGDNEVQLRVWDPSGNESSCKANVRIKDNFEALRNRDFIVEDFVQIRLGETYEFDISDPLIAGISYYWFPIDYLSCSDCLNPEAKVLEDIQYTFIVEDEEGCLSLTDEVVLNLRYDEPAFIPNVFSPNGDGINDYFEVFPSIMIERVSSMKIYDRWGNLVFQAAGEETRWDGRHNGKLLSSGVFLYELDLLYIDGKQHLQQGSLSLID